jgi:DNA-binding FadR family transcriptional regulator
MSVSGITSTTNAYQTNTQTNITNNYKQWRTEFRQLAQALQSGDLSGAQQAFSNLQQIMPNYQNTTQGQSSNTISTTGATTNNDFMQQLAQALQSGDLSGAQQAFSNLQQAIQGHHHGHHHGESTNTTATTTSTATVGNNLSTVA